MSISTRSSRPATPPPHKSRRAYLEKDAGVNYPKICHAMARKLLNSKPWPTLMLGSGCTPTDSQKKALSAVPGRLRRKVTTHLSVPDYIYGEPVGQVAERFAKDLISDRLRITSEPSKSDGVEIDDWVFELVVAAALTTKLYFEIKARGWESLRRRDHRNVAVLRENSKGGKLEQHYIKPCREVLASLLEFGDKWTSFRKAWDSSDRNYESTLRETLESLLQRVASGLGEAQGAQEVQLSLVDVQSLAEFAWFWLGDTTGKDMIYLGWSDLLLDLSNYDAPTEGRVGTPLFRDLMSAQKFLARRYRAVTKASWSQVDPKRELYDAAAEQLQAQHEERNRFLEVDAPPAATAFVSSFDLELELALLRQGKPFTVALPVHVLPGTSGTRNLAHTVWLALNVIPQRSNRLKPLLEGTLDAWSLLTEECAKDGPVVIRLAGCPSINLPPLPVGSSLKGQVVELLADSLKALIPPSVATEEERAKALDEIVVGLHLEHAVILSEHDALWHSSVDQISLRSEAAAYPIPSIQKATPFGLPAAFGVGNRRWTRFWLMLGVQIHDSAVRHRIASLLSTLPYGLSTGVGGFESQRYGVAVNTYLSELEQDVLFWNGFDVVRDDAWEFTQDLRHYTAHLLEARPLRSGGVCDAI
jgi:hypothetical protein